MFFCLVFAMALCASVYLIVSIPDLFTLSYFHML